MGGVSGLYSSFVPAPRLPVDLGALLRHPLPAQLEGTPGDLAVTVRGVRIPLSDLPRFQPGQDIMLEVVQQGGAFLLRITPKDVAPGQTAELPGHAARIAPQTAAAIVRANAGEPSPGTSSPRPGEPFPASHPVSAPTQPGALGEMVARLATSIGMSERAGDLLMALPTHVALPESAVRALLPLLALRGALGSDMDGIQSLISRAIAAEAIPRDMGEALIRVLNQTLPQNATDLRGALEHTMQRTTVSAEAQLIRLAMEGAEIPERLTALQSSLRNQITSLRENADFLRFLASQGETGRFETAVERILERLTGIEVQNLRGTGQAYHFAELAFPPGAPIHQAQIHFFDRAGGGKGRRFTANQASIVFDIATSRLGDLWINLTIAAERCTCLFRVRQEAALRAIEAESATLAAKLADAGYPGAQVQTALWDGDRIRETARLMQQFAGINVSG